MTDVFPLRTHLSQPLPPGAWRAIQPNNFSLFLTPGVLIQRIGQNPSKSGNVIIKYLFFLYLLFSLLIPRAPYFCAVDNSPRRWIA